MEIDIFLTPSFQALIDVKYAERNDKSATELEKPFKETFECGFFSEKSEFDKAFEEEAPLDVKDLGNLVCSAETTDGTTFQILHSNLSTASKQLKYVHSHLQPLLLFFVDAACTIDGSDPNWEILLAVEIKADKRVEVVGFATVYKFYVYPNNTRLRLSQILVLPPHQGRGVGTLLVDALYKLAGKMQAVDITLEDPTDDIRRMKDKKDLTAMRSTQWLKDEASNMLKDVLENKGKAEKEDNVKESQVSPLSASTNTLERMQKELRMSRHQSRRMWEALIFEQAQSIGATAVAATEGLVRASIEAAVTSAKQGSANKVITETETGFVMCKTKKNVTLGMIPVEEMTEVQQQEAIDAAVNMRLTELRRMILGEQGVTNDDIGQ